MKSLKYFAMLAVLMVPLALTQAAQAQVRVGIGIGVPGYVAGPPVCEYGYYPYAPYACAPYGYYGPSWFAGGIFIGAGPWYHGWGRPFYPGYGYYRGPIARGFVGRGFEGRGFAGRGFEGRGNEGRGFSHGPVRGDHGPAPRVGGGGRTSGGEFHGGGSHGGRR
jgi:hypothetical protein